jgi:hypothetical protein
MNWFRLRSPTCPVCRALPEGGAGSVASSGDTETFLDDDTSSGGDTDEMTLLSPETLHRLVRPCLLACRRATATRQQKQLRGKYLRARERLSETKRNLRAHRLYSSGPYVQLRRQSAALEKTVASAEARLRGVAAELMRDDRAL